MKLWRFALLLVFAGQASATSMPSRTIRVRELADLVRTSDVIAQVRITAGEGGERFEPVYRAQVEQAFKGIEAGTVLHLGGRFEIGSVHLVFLDRAGLVKDHLRAHEISRSFPADAPYYETETDLFSQFPLVVTEAFGDVDVVASFASEWVTLPEDLRQVAVQCADEPAKGLVLRDELYAWIRKHLR
jgi:hypothetical protein